MSDHISVLCIDDEENIRTLVEYNLRLDGFNVLLAPNGRKGLKAAKKEQPDLILLDIMMKGMDGLEVLAKLKQDERTRGIPVFMLTAKSLIGDMERAFKMGADDYIVKPFEADMLSQTIKRKLENYKYRGWEVRDIGG
ncbi:MAG: response regulator [Proteobacteria bacterium]|nr:response regulator [Pseudomonadota bacterium]